MERAFMNNLELQTIKTTVDEDGIMTVWIDVPGKSINIGLPETKIGILPGWGGTVRLPKLIGITRALPLILQGKALPPRKAKKIGMIDEVVRPEAILSAAKRLLITKPTFKRKWLFVDKLAKVGLFRHKILANAEAKPLAT